MDKFIEWVTSKFQHPFSLLFFLLGAVLLLLGLTTGLNVPGLQQLVPDVNFRWIALVLGAILLLGSVLLYYRPPSPAKAAPSNSAMPVTPEELRQSFAARVDALTEPQRQLLSFVRREGLGRRFVSQDTVEARFNQWSKAELYYRLEHLRLLGFLERQRIGTNEQGFDRFTYRISAAYQEELGDTEPVAA